MEKNKTMIHTQFRVPKETWEKLKVLAKKERRSINSEIVYVIEEYLKGKN